MKHLTLTPSLYYEFVEQFTDYFMKKGKNNSRNNKQYYFFNGVTREKRKRNAFFKRFVLKMPKNSLKMANFQL